MKKIKRPEIKINDFLKRILKGRQNNKSNEFIKERLQHIEDYLMVKEQDYLNKAENNMFYDINENDNITLSKTEYMPHVTKLEIDIIEMKKAYNNYIVSDTTQLKVGRKVYDQLFDAVQNNVCPYCLVRTISTMDHFLPQSKYIDYVLTPINLVPCCYDCNKNKSNKVGYNFSRFFHPYFDDFKQNDWLTCNISESFPITFNYKIADNFENVDVKNIIEFHFKELKLEEVFAQQAVYEFGSVVFQLVKEFKSDPKDKGKKFIEDAIQGSSYNEDYRWKRSMYKALLDSKWFFNIAIYYLEDFYLK